jgi:hypothetical protein
MKIIGHTKKIAAILPQISILATYNNLHHLISERKMLLRSKNLIKTVASNVKSLILKLFSFDPFICMLCLPRVLSFYLVQKQSFNAPLNIRILFILNLSRLIKACIHNLSFDKSSKRPVRYSFILGTFFAKLLVNLKTDCRNERPVLLLLIASSIKYLGSYAKQITFSIFPLLRFLLIKTSHASKNKELDAAREKTNKATLGLVLFILKPTVFIQMLMKIFEKESVIQKKLQKWILHLLKLYVDESNLLYWGKKFLPIVKMLFLLDSKNSNNIRPKQSLVYKTLVVYTLSVLLSFVSLCKDLSKAIILIVKDLAKVYQQRSVICYSIETAFERVCFLTNFALQQFRSNKLVTPDWRDTSHVIKNVKILRLYAKNFIPILMNALMASIQSKRTQIIKTIVAFVSILDNYTSTSVITGFLNIAINSIPASNKLPFFVISELSIEKRLLIIELVTYLTKSLKVNEMDMLYSSVKSWLCMYKSSYHKKCYQLMFNLLNFRPDFFTGFKYNECMASVLGNFTDMQVNYFQMQCIRVLLVNPFFLERAYFFFNLF